MTPTREQVIQWAREAGFIGVGGFLGESTAPFEHFATLAVAAGQQAEREKLELVAVTHAEVTNTGYAYVKAIDRAIPHATELYRIREEQ